MGSRSEDSVVSDLSHNVEERKSEVAVPPIEEIVDKIFALESSKGKYNYSKCEAIGEFNRYGFGIPGNGKYLCFEKDKDTEAVKKWFADKIKTNQNINQLICKYNTGIESDSCSYLEKYYSI